MLLTIAVLILILWLLGMWWLGMWWLGMISSYMLGGFISILLVVAIIAVLLRVIQRRSPVA